jgi:hypothetical protein
MSLILLETTSNLDSVVECLVAANKHLLFVLYRHCVKLCIMDIKLCCDQHIGVFHNKLYL